MSRLRIETDGTPDTTRLFVGGCFRPLVQRVHLTVGPDYAPPLLETQEMVASVYGHDMMHPEDAPWVIESNSYNDTHVYRKGESLADTHLITALEFGCEANGRTYLKISRMLEKARDERGNRILEVKDGAPVVVEETLFEHWAEQQTA